MDIFRIILEGLLLFKIKKIKNIMNYPSDNRRYVIDRVQQVFLQSFNHAVNLETLEILVSNMIRQALQVSYQPVLLLFVK